MAEEQTAEIVTTNIEEGESEAKDDGEASVAEDENTAAAADDPDLSQPEGPTPDESEAAAAAAAAEEPPISLPPDVVPDDADAEPSPQSVEHDSVSVTRLTEQGTFGIQTPTITAVAASASAAPAATASITAETTDDGEMKKEESDTAEEQQQQQTFVNHGLAAWEESRRRWLNHQDAGDGADMRTVKTQHAVPVNVDEIIDVVFASPRQLRANGGKGRNFPQPVALPQMVDILQDLWEAEGLDV